MNNTNLFQVAEVQLTFKSHSDLMSRPKLTTDTDAVNILYKVEEMKQNIDYKELFYALYLNTTGRVLSVGKVAEGTATHCQVNTRQIIQSALMQNATGLILCHNHPSGDTFPSPDDITVTQVIQKAAQLFEIKVIDHIIISSFGYTTFKEMGLI
jgi:DNA repair protein RadC